MDVNKDQGALDTSNDVKGKAVEIIIEGTPTTSSVNKKSREIPEVNKDHGTLDTSDTAKGKAIDVIIEGAPTTSSVNKKCRETIGQGATANSNIHHSVSPGSDSEQCIFKVHSLLRNVNSKDYEPEIISIGPYHYGKPNLRLMEAHKLRFQKLMLERRGEELSVFVEAIKGDEEKARKSYAESTAHIPSEEFVKMLVLDGIFIIELLWKFDKGVRETVDSEVSEVQNIRNDPLFRMPWAMTLLQRDLMLFENQLPFFILVKLYRMILPPGKLANLLNFALKFFNDLLPGKGSVRKSSSSTGGDKLVNTKHLLDVIHRKWGSQKVNDQNGIRSADLELIGCTENLREAGIKFEKIDGEVCFDIEFKNGALRMPVMNIELRTESFLRNLIAFEQYYGDYRFHAVTDYMQLFTCLVKSDKDIARLTRFGILKSRVSDDVEVSNMFKKILYGTIGPSNNFHYADIFRRVNEHCRKPKNKYMATLRRDYLKSPWKITGVFSGSALLFLGILELTFQILSWQSQIWSLKSQIKGYE